MTNNNQYRGKALVRMTRMLLTAFFLLLIPLSITAQEESPKLPVDWNAVKKEVENNPSHVKDLVTRMSAQKLDTTLTYPDRILAFYGQSFLTNDAEDVYRMDMDKLEKEGKREECLALAKKMLDINPLSLTALFASCNNLIVMAKDSTQWKDVTMDDVEPYLNRAMRILNTIAVTGDGSAEHPFCVTKVSDEYCFMRYYLDLWDYKQQTATSCCDVITLDGSSEYYNRPEIYFDITRVYELERLMFQK